MNDIIARLQFRRPELVAMDAVWKKIQDVLAGNVVKPDNLYLPKGKLEVQSEYEMRVRITPYFPETPQILISRLSALFTEPLEFPDATAAQLAFIDRAGFKNVTMTEIAEKNATAAQQHGFCMLVADRRPDGTPYLCIYEAPDVYDFELSPDGEIIWLKLHERFTRQVSLSAPRQTVDCFRIYSQSTLDIHEIVTTPGKDAEHKFVGTFRHGFPDIPVMPYVPFAPWPELPRPILERTSDADVAATRVLSDLTWNLYLVGNPILTWTCDDPDAMDKKINTNPSRYIPLQKGKVGITESDKIEFVQLHPSGLELLFKMHELCVNQAQKHTQTGPAAELPTQQSAAAHVARFVLSEGRVLEKLARSTERLLSQAIALCTGSPCTVKVTELNLAAAETPQGAKKDTETGG